MNVNNLKKPQKRFSTRYLQKLNIQTYGADNLYPQTISQIIGSSSIGGSCLNRYATFIEGNGFDSTMFSRFVCNHREETVDDILSLVAQDLAKYHGFALHVNYNALGQIVELQHVHFEDCRLEEEDDNGYVAHIVTHPDWSGQKTRKGQTIRVEESNIRRYFPFNPRPEVVFDQITKCGGIERYCGQIMWVSMDGAFQYPKPIYDDVVTCLSIDEGIDNVSYRNVRNNFLPSGAFIHRKGTLVGMDEDGNAIEPTERDERFGESLDIFVGDTNANSIMDVTYESDEDKPEFINFRGNNFDKDFDSTSTRVTEKIYNSFQQEVWHLIAIGKIGFGGDVIYDAYKVYNSFVSKERRTISRAFERIFSHWEADLSLPIVENYEIQPLVWVVETDTTENGQPTDITTDNE